MRIGLRLVVGGLIVALSTPSLLGVQATALPTTLAAICSAANGMNVRGVNNTTRLALIKKLACIAQVIVNNPPTPAPTLASTPSPADTATGIAVSVALSWVAGTSALTVTHDVYFGTTDPPPIVASGQVSATYSPGTLIAGTVYYWRVAERNTSGANVGPVWRFTTAASSSTGLLTTAKLSCAGVFLSFNYGDVSGGQTPGGAVAMKKVSGTRHYFGWAGDGHIYEFVEPTLAPCNSALSLLAYASVTDWGTFTLSNGDGYLPGLNQSYGLHLAYDATTDWLIPSWSGTYSTIPRGNSFAGLSFNTGSHTLTTVGCWMVNRGMPTVGSGWLEIPTTFRNAYLSGKRWGVGVGGGFATVSEESSFGPAIIAIDQPSANACAAATNYNQGAGTVVSLFTANMLGTGPVCRQFDGTLEPSGHNLNCGTTVAPSTPYPARTAFTQYSVDLYQPDWEPYAGHGWWGSVTFGAAAMYDDGVVAALISAYEAPRGWAKTAIQASPAPTMVGSNGTMRVASTSTHDGYHMRVGDTIYVPTCTNPPDGANCEITNNRNRSGVLIDSVNTSTGDITFHINNAIATDFGTGASGYVPVVGQDVYFGAIYAHGGLVASRGSLRLALYDFARLAEVVQGPSVRQPYDLVYNEDIDLIDAGLVPGFSQPYTRFNQSTGTPAAPTPSAVMVDVAAQQIIIAFKNGRSGANAMYVFNVSH